MASGGISGVAVALATAGGVLLYAGFQGKTPIEALKDITSGKTAELAPSSVSFVNDPTQIGLGAAGGGGGVIAADWAGGSGSSAFGSRLVAAAMTHRNERYSQAKRWEPGYSDCSSFVGKSLKDIGITPPGGSNTFAYLGWSKLRTVPKDQIQAGDILCSSAHMAIAMGDGRAIGQQNGRQNVRIDSVSNLMWGQSWTPRRYVGAAGKPSAPGKSSGGGAVAEA